MASFGERLKKLRMEKGLTQKQLAAIFNTTERGYRNYEIEKTKPNYETLLMLSDFFDTSLDYLTGRSDNPKRL